MSFRSSILTIFACAILAYSKQENPQGCKTCQNRVSIMWSHMQTEENVQNQIQFLNEFVCHDPSIQEPDRCMVGVQLWWPRIASNIYSYSTVPKVCSNVFNGSCEAGIWDCDTCIRDVKLVAEVYTSLDAITEWIGIFQGETLCTDWALALDDTQIQTCQDIIEAFMGPALIAMAAFLTELAQNVICHSWFNEIC